MPKALLLLLISCCLFACGPDNSEQAARRADWSKVQLICETLSQSDEAPRSAVYALLQESKIKLAEISACDTVVAEDYAQLGIPKDALTAVGSWWAGYGEYIYAIIEEDALRLYIGGIGEESEAEHPQYAPLARYQGDQFQLLRPLHPADLAGYYMHQGVDTSYVLFLGLKGPNLVSKLFATAEPLPAQKVLQRALPEFAASPDLEFNCNLNGLDFQSGLGDGQIYWQPDSAAVTFNTFLGKEETKVFELMLY
ncbi:MAG: hypothetical protein AAFY48_06990 [Bacteroidota bacterium]